MGSSRSCRSHTGARFLWHIVTKRAPADHKLKSMIIAHVSTTISVSFGTLIGLHLFADLFSLLLLEQQSDHQHILHPSLHQYWFPLVFLLQLSVIHPILKWGSQGIFTQYVWKMRLTIALKMFALHVALLIKRESEDLTLGKLKFWFCTKEVEDLQSEEIGGGKINTFPRKTLRDAFFANKYYLRHRQRAITPRWENIDKNIIIAPVFKLKLGPWEG